MPAAKRQPKNQRPDPEPRSLDGVAGDIALVDADPAKKYVWVAGRSQLREYRRMGYRPETQREGGVAMLGEADGPVQEGKEIEFDGHVLMSVSAEKAEKIFQEGAHGATGQKLWDALDRQIVKKRGGVDHFRGMTGVRRGQGQQPYFSVENETTALAPDDDDEEN